MKKNTLILSEYLPLLHMVKSSLGDISPIKSVSWHNNIFVYFCDNDRPLYIPLVESGFKEYSEDFFKKRGMCDSIDKYSSIFIKVLSELFKKEDIGKIVFIFEELDMSNIFLGKVLQMANIPNDVVVSYYTGISQEEILEIESLITDSDNQLSSEEFVQKGNILFKHYEQVQSISNKLIKQDLPYYRQSIYSFLEMVQEKNNTLVELKSKYCFRGKTDIGEFVIEVPKLRDSDNSDEALFYLSNFENVTGVKITEVAFKEKRVFPPFFYDEFSLYLEILSRGDISYEKLKSLFEPYSGELISLFNAGAISAPRRFADESNISASMLAKVKLNPEETNLATVEQKILAHPSYKNGFYIFPTSNIIDISDATGATTIYSLVAKQTKTLFKDPAVVKFITVSAVPVYQDTDTEEGIFATSTRIDTLSLGFTVELFRGWYDDWEMQEKGSHEIPNIGDILPLIDSIKLSQLNEHSLYKNMLYPAILKYKIIDPRLAFHLIDEVYSLGLVEDKRIGGMTGLTTRGKQYLKDYAPICKINDLKQNAASIDIFINQHKGEFDVG